VRERWEEELVREKIKRRRGSERKMGGRRGKCEKDGRKKW
jgi:hypothetical protein